MKKRRFMTILVMIAIMITSVNAYAETITFNITVGGNNPDTLSRRAIKNPDDTDNYFYVTGHTFSNRNNTVLAKSFHITNSSIYTQYGTVIMSYTQSANYRVKAPHNQYYYMNTEFQNGLGGKTNITGNYTP